MSIRPQIIGLALITTANGLLGAPAVAQGIAPRVGVVCVLSEQSAFPFSAGDNRCFSAINGRTLVPKYTAACLIRGNDYTRINFMFSAVPNVQCGGLAAYGNPASKDEY